MSKAYSLQELAAYTGAQLQGDASRCFQSVAAVDQAGPSDISYIRGGKYQDYLQSTQAGCLILNEELAALYQGDCLVCADPYLAYAKVVTLLNPPVLPAAGVHSSAVLAEDVVMGEGCSIGAHAVLEAGVVLGDNVTIGAGCVIGRESRLGHDSLLHANVTLAYATELGERCILHSGVVLGADGFGFAPDKSTWYKIPQIGNVILGNDVEIGANTCIDRAAMGATRIGDGVKIDNLVQVGHNVQIGDHTAIAACAAIAGSVKIGRYCRIAGMAGLNGHITIADSVTITATTFVTHSILEAGVYSSGTTVDSNRQWRKNAVRFQQLDTIARRLNTLEQQLATLQEKDRNQR